MAIKAADHQCFTKKLLKVFGKFLQNISARDCSFSSFSSLKPTTLQLSLLSSYFLRNVRKSYNLGQILEEKLTKLSKVDFLLECFSVDLFSIFWHNSQNLSFGLPVGQSFPVPTISGILLKLLNLLRSHVLSRSTTCETTGTFTFC